MKIDFGFLCLSVFDVIFVNVRHSRNQTFLILREYFMDLTASTLLSRKIELSFCFFHFNCFVFVVV